MAIPDFQSLMLPLLRFASDGTEKTLSEAIKVLADQFHLSENERKEMLPSGLQPRFNNRVGWAKTYLKKTGLLEDQGRGRFRITSLALTLFTSRQSAGKARLAGRSSRLSPAAWKASVLAGES